MVSGLLKLAVAARIPSVPCPRGHGIDPLCTSANLHVGLTTNSKHGGCLPELKLQEVQLHHATRVILNLLARATSQALRHQLIRPAAVKQAAVKQGTAF